MEEDDDDDDDNDDDVIILEIWILAPRFHNDAKRTFSPVGKPQVPK